MVQIPVGPTGRSIFREGTLPALLYAGQISGDPHWSFPPHKHDELSEIVYISEGEGSFMIGGAAYRGEAGDLLIYNRGVVHEERSNPDRPLKTYFCGVGNLAIDGIQEGWILPAHRSPVIRAHPYRAKIESYLSDIFEEVDNQIIGYETICQHLLVSLIVLIHRIIGSQNAVVKSADRHSLGARIKDYLDKHFDQDIPLGEIANRLYISPSYMSHTFKEQTGYSPINYVIQLRVGEAKKLLLTTNLSVRQIAQSVGYENANYFSMLFKKVTGASPLAFRGSNKS